MTTFTQDKKVTLVEIKKAFKEFLPFSVRKIGENLLDLVITMTTVGITIAWIATMQDIAVTTGEMIVYIITIFLLIVVRRVIHDFDDSYTTDEIGDNIAEISERLGEIHRIMKSESMLSEDEFNERLRS
jgi:hypothetical protein